jgi:transcriptional regulator with XRE-family HTH domain
MPHGACLRRSGCGVPQLCAEGTLDCLISARLQSTLGHLHAYAVARTVRKKILVMGLTGEWIRRLREQRGFTREQVEALTREFAQKTGNEHNWIRHGRLAHIERGEAVPDIYTVQSFAEIYQVAYERVLQGFGVDIPTLRRLLPLPSTSPAPYQVGSLEPRHLAAPSLRQISFKETRLLIDPTESAEVLRAILGLEFDEAFTRIGLIASTDDSMGPYVPPGSAVKIDTRHKIIESAAWRDLIERPIYFIWHEEGYSCCWCDQRENKLILLPHPASHRAAMQLNIPGQATVIGRVTHVWSPLPGIESTE